jgi:2TM domain-containing protein
MKAAANAARRAEARRRVAALKGFYIHLIVCVLVVAGLLIINSLTGGPWWVAWVFLGWGLGVLAHGLALLARRSRGLAASRGAQA